MTQLINRNNTKSHHAKKLPMLVEIKINENDGKRIDQCKERLSLCHIGLVKVHGGHLVNQAPLLLTDKC